MLFNPQRGPFTYRFFNLETQQGYDVFKQAVDPNNKLRTINVQVNDTGVRKFFWKHAFRNVSAADSSEKLYEGLQEVYNFFKDTSTIKNLGITFEPSEDESSLTVIISPHHASKVFYRFSNSLNFSDFGMLGTVGVRNIAGLLNTLSFYAYKGFQRSTKNYYCLEYKMPLLYKRLVLELQIGQFSDFLNRGTVLNHSFKSIGFFSDTKGVHLQYYDRWATINPIYHSRESLEQNLVPDKHMKLVGQILWRDIGPKHFVCTMLTGELSHTENSGKFFSLETVNYLNLFPRGFLFGKKFKFIGLENSFSSGLVVPFRNSKLSGFDRFYRNNLRGFSEIETPETPYDHALHPLAKNTGFEFLGDYIGDNICLKNTTKLSFIKTPPFAKIGATPFLYLTCGYFSGDIVNNRAHRGLNPAKGGGRDRIWGISSLMEEMREKSRISMGVGIHRSLGELVKFEALTSLFTLGKKTDSVARFQIKFAILD